MGQAHVAHSLILFNMWHLQNKKLFLKSLDYFESIHSIRILCSFSLFLFHDRKISIITLFRSFFQCE